MLDDIVINFLTDSDALLLGHAFGDCLGHDSRVNAPRESIADEAAALEAILHFLKHLLKEYRFKIHRRAAKLVETLGGNGWILGLVGRGADSARDGVD